VFAFIFRAILSLQKGFGMLLVMILVGVTLSNAVALFVSYGVAKTFLPLLHINQCMGFADHFTSSVTPLWEFNFHAMLGRNMTLFLAKIFGTDKALLLGIAAGSALSFLHETSPIKQKAKHLAIKSSNLITVFLQKIFIPLLPFYVFGFCLKLSYDDALIHLFTHYGRVFLLSMSLMLVYLLLFYALAQSLSKNFSFTKILHTIKAFLPAGLTGFSTMSTAATLPVTLECAERATQNRSYADLVIPATGNIHMLGDDLTVTMTAMALLMLCGHGMPDFYTFFLYTCAFCIAKFSCVGIPGASVLVILPVLQQFLGFTPEMVSMLTTIYILQDPFGTFGNVMGNGAFATGVYGLFKRIRN
jgi:Na+/H+-dicarboxylate symporter